MKNNIICVTRGGSRLEIAQIIETWKNLQPRRPKVNETSARLWKSNISANTRVFFVVVRINIFQASLTDSYYILSLQPEKILKIFLFFLSYLEIKRLNSLSVYYGKISASI